jgi:hypothetical protein
MFVESVGVGDSIAVGRGGGALAALAAVRWPREKWPRGGDSLAVLQTGDSAQAPPAMVWA